LSSIYLYKIVKEFHPEGNPLFAVFLLLIFPTAFFLNAVYSESVFLFFSLASFYYSFKKQYLLAGIFGFLASLTRITGILLFIPVLFEYLKEHRQRFFKPTLLKILLIPLGTLSFFFYHYLKFGDFFLFFKVEKLWGRGFHFNLDQLNLLTNPAISNFSLDLSFLIFALITTFFVFKNLRFSYGIYMVSTLIVALSSGTAMSIGRYILILFPIYILGSTIKSEICKYIWVLVSVLFLGLYTLLFVNHYWAG
jgi:Gpi18-like mannosyltransferase